MTEVLHQRHQFDKFPICWGINKIVKYKLLSEGAGTKVTALVNLVSCPTCVTIRNGGAGVPVGFTSSGMSPTRGTQGGSVVQGRVRAKRNLRGIL